MKICSKMRYYNNELAIFKDSPEILNNRYNPVIRLKSFFNTSYVNMLLRRKRLVPLLVAFIFVILWRWPPVTDR